MISNQNTDTNNVINTFKKHITDTNYTNYVPILLSMIEYISNSGLLSKKFSAKRKELNYQGIIMIYKIHNYL